MHLSSWSSSWGQAYTQGERESRLQGKGGQVCRAESQQRSAKCDQRNFIFNPHPPNAHDQPVLWHRPPIWEGRIVRAVLKDSCVAKPRIPPLLLVDADGREDVPYETRTFSVLAQGQRAEQIFEHGVADSAKVGATMQRDNDRICGAPPMTRREEREERVANSRPYFSLLHSQ